MILLILLTLEAALSLFRQKTKNMQYRLTVVLRGVSVLLLLILSALSFITWGLRYYALTAVFVISALMNVIKAVRGQEKRPLRIVRKAFCMSALLIFAYVPVILFPEYKPLPTTGEYTVATETMHLTDLSRAEIYARAGARTLTVQFWYPSDSGGSCSLIVFSHGSFGTRTSNESLLRELASCGFVVCSIDHTYQCLYTTAEDGSIKWISGEYMDELRRENAKADRQNSLGLYQKWMDVRVDDISFVIDKIKSTSGGLFDIINTEKVGVIGHSLGGSAALGVGRIRDDIGAVVALESPFMCDIIGVKDGEFVFESAPYPVPVLNIYSDSSWEHLSVWPQYARNAQILSDSDENTQNLHISGIGHLSLTDLSLASPILTRILNGSASSLSAEDTLQKINEECVAFFIRYLED